MFTSLFFAFIIITNSIIIIVIITFVLFYINFNLTWSLVITFLFSYFTFLFYFLIFLFYFITLLLLAPTSFLIPHSLLLTPYSLLLLNIQTFQTRFQSTIPSYRRLRNILLSEHRCWMILKYQSHVVHILQAGKLPTGAPCWTLYTFLSSRYPIPVESVESGKK